MSVEPDSGSAPVIALGPSVRMGSTGGAVACSPASSSSARAPALGVDEQRVLVRVTAVFGQEVAAMDFRTSSKTALSKLLLSWCSEHGCAPGDVRFSLADGAEPQGQTLALPLETTIAEVQGRTAALGIAPAEAVTLQATPEPGAEKHWPSEAPAAAGRRRLVGSLGAAALGPAALQAAQLLSVRVVAESQGRGGRAPSDDETQFWVPPELPMASLMAEWCAHHRIEQSDVRFFLDGRELLPTDTLHQWGFNAKQGSGSAGRAAIQISAEPSSLEAANRSQPPETLQSSAPSGGTCRASSSETIGKPGQAARVQIRTEAVGALATRLQGLSQKAVAGGMKCYMKAGAPLRKIMDLWCQEQGLTRKELIFRLGSGYAIQPEDTAEKLGCQADEQVTFYVELRPTNVPPDRRLVVTVSDGSKPGDEGLDFKMLPETSFERLMKKWCELNQKGLQDVAFLLEDGSAALRPHDSPVGVRPSILGCNGSTLRIRVESVQKASAPQYPVRQNRPIAESLVTAGQRANGSAQPAQPALDNRVVVAIEAEAAGVKEKLKFRMNSTVSFEKVLAAWCKSHTPLHPREAVRLSIPGSSRKLTVQDTPQSCNWQPQDGILNISVVLIAPRSQASVAEVPRKAAEASGASSAHGARGAGASASASGSVYASALAAASASAASAAPAASQQASAAAPPAPAAVAPSARTASASSDASQASAASVPAASGTGEKVVVEVVAELAEEASLTQFPMKSTTEFEKMMKAWASKHGQQLDDVVFSTVCPNAAGVESRREVMPHESPSTLGWSSGTGVLSIQVMHRSKKEGTSAERANEPANTNAKTNGRAETANAANGAVTKKAVNDDKIKVQVVALGPDGEVTDEFTMRVTTPFEKMMRAWSKQNEIDVDEARFELNGHILKPAETPAHFGWSTEKGVLVIKASPTDDEDGESQVERADEDAMGRHVPEAAAITQEAAATSAPSAASAAAPAPAFVPEPAPALAPALAPASTPMPTSGLPSNSGTNKETSIDTADKKDGVAIESSAASAAAPLPEKVMVQVVAEGEDNSTELNFKMKGSTPFEKMMWKWCETFRIPPAEVCFTVLDGRELKPEDTPDSCNWSPQKGTLIVNAVPRESTPDDIASAATPARTSESVLSGQEVARAASAEVDEAAGVAQSAEADAEQETKEAGDGATGAALAEVGLAAAASCAVVDGAARAARANEEAARAEPANVDEAARAAPANVDEAAGVASTQAAPANLSLQAATSAAAGGTGDGGADAAAAVPHAIPSAAMPAATAGEPSAAAAVPAKVSIKVIARCEEGDNVIDVKMKPSSPFEKMMKAWCQQTGFSLDEVEFLRDGKLLQLQDTPDSLGFKPEDGELVIEAQPREEGTGDDKGSNAQASKDQAQDGEDVRVTVMAVCASGEVAKVAVKMKSNSPFRKMMQAWCDHQGLALDAVSFELCGLPLRPEDSPISRGWTAAQGDIEVHAIPRQQELKEPVKAKSSPSAPSNQSQVQSPKDDTAAGGAAAAAATTTTTTAATVSLPDKRAAPDHPAPAAKVQVVSTAVAPTATVPDKRAAPERPAPAAKIQVQVVASGPQGQNIVNVTMKATSCFEKMMDAWCKKNGISQDSVSFLLEDGRELQGTDSPQSCGAQGSLKIKAVGKARAQASGAPAKDGPMEAQPAAPRSTAPRTTETAGSAVAAAPPKMPEADAVPVEDVKVEIAVHAEGEDGAFVQNVRMKAGSPFSKVMAAFCKEVGIPVEEACFSYSSRELKPEDTPFGVGWRPGGGILDVHARPRDEQPPAASNDATKTDPAAGSTAAAAAAASAPGLAVEAPRGDQKVAVRIVAMSANEEVILEYELSSSAEFGTIMKQWYEHHGLPKGSARFLLEGSPIRETDSPASLGRATSQGPLRVVAEPRDDEEEESNDAPGPGASASAAPDAAKPPAPPVTEAGVGAAADGAAEPVGAVEVKVVADGSDGRNVLTFKMKLSTSFGKMMSKWCEHHGIRQDLAMFLYGTRELLAEETPHVLGWSPTQPGDSVTIQAMPRSAVTSSNRSKEKGKKRKMTQGANAEEPAPKRAASAYQLFAKARRPALVEERPELKSKMAEQTKALSSEWRELSEELRRPYEEEAARDRQRAEAERAAYAARQPAAASGVAATAAPAAPAAAPAAAQQLADDAGIAMLVVAEGEDGPCEDRFKLKMSTPLGKMMSAWCNAHEIPEDDATFALGGLEAQMQFALRKTDTAADLRRRFGAKVLADAGLTGEGTELLVRAVPNDGPEFEEALKARETLETSAAISGSSSSASSTTASAPPTAGPAPQSPSVPPKAAPKQPRALKRQRSDTSAARGGSTTASRSRRPRRSTTGIAAEDEEKAGSDCSASASDGDGQGQNLRRSARLREAQPIISASATIIHHTPHFSQKRSRKEAATPEAAASPEDKARAESEYMSFEEYLKYDKEQAQLVAKAREERQKRMLVSGVEGEDEEFQLAMALSLSMTQGSVSDAPPAEGAAAAVASAPAASVSTAPAGEQLEAGGS